MDLGLLSDRLQHDSINKEGQKDGTRKGGMEQPDGQINR